MILRGVIGMNRDIKEKLNSVSRRSLEGLLNDVLRKNQVSIKKPRLSSKDKNELRSLLKDLNTAFEQITKNANK
jgi:hypothetical protein